MKATLLGDSIRLIGYGTKLKMNIFGGKSGTVWTGSPAISGHVEGDIRIVSGFIKLICDEITDLKDITTIDATIISHDIALAAEESRKNGGMPINL